jgi:hypothetical protein
VNSSSEHKWCCARVRPFPSVEEPPQWTLLWGEELIKLVAIEADMPLTTFVKAELYGAAEGTAGQIDISLAGAGFSPALPDVGRVPFRITDSKSKAMHGHAVRPNA